VRFYTGLMANSKSEDKNGLKLSKAEVENLLKRGAYAVFNEEDNDASKQSTGNSEEVLTSIISAYYFLLFAKHETFSSYFYRLPRNTVSFRLCSFGSLAKEEPCR
jgi:hypothetical protein